MLRGWFLTGATSLFALLEMENTEVFPFKSNTCWFLPPPTQTQPLKHSFLADLNRAGLGRVLRGKHHGRARVAGERNINWIRGQFGA